MLEAAHKREIIGMMAMGASKTLAAQFIGCSVSTIYRERRRDPQFRQEMERAAAQNVLHLKQLMRRHAERSWRAAAWLLEREYPHMYARRRPTEVSPEQSLELVNAWWDLVDKCPYAKARRWIRRHAARLSRHAERFAAAHSHPWERDQRPQPTDLAEVEDELDSDDDPAEPDDIEPDLEDIDLDRDPEDERLRQAAITPPERSRWPHDRKFTMRDEQGQLWHLDLDNPLPHPQGGYYDMERLREAVEFARPRPDPLSSAWIHWCQDEGIGPEEKARLEAEYREQLQNERREQELAYERLGLHDPADRARYDRQQAELYELARRQAAEQRRQNIERETALARRRALPSPRQPSPVDPHRTDEPPPDTRPPPSQ